ncbi:TspO/MBR family protein [Nocardioides sp. SYSU DS0663]|uniref:TspO/MBR family protein n=1 Tax=Nocardioides sp. SYSU DS0663 TaxID=3416445 RepID=UPI003F4B2316
MAAPSEQTAHRSTLTAPPGSSTHAGLGLAAFVAAVAVAAALGAVAAGSAESTYDRLELPQFAPPSWVFGPVWTVLYGMIAIAGWLLWRQRGVDRAVVVWAVQLVLNAAWTPLFFAAGAYALALVEILALLASVVALIALAVPRSRAAALLLVPYAAWVAFATALNASIWWLNR